MRNDPTFNPGHLRKQAKVFDALRSHLKDCMGFAGGHEGGLRASSPLRRPRTLSEHLDTYQQQLEGYMAGDLSGKSFALTAPSTRSQEFSSDDL